MKKRLVLATSTSCLDYYPEKHDVEIIRIKVIIEGKVYEDGLDLQANDFYKMLRADSDLLPNTSQPSVGELIDLFEKLHDEGYEELFIVTISLNLSGAYNSISLAAKEMSDKMKITVFDSKTVFAAEAEMALIADKMFKEGKEAEEIVKVLESMQPKLTIFFVCEDLNCLIKNGRLTGAKAFFGKLLKIKPLLEVNSNGQIVSIDKQRTTAKAIDSLVNSTKAFIGNDEAQVITVYSGKELSDKITDELKNKLNITPELAVPASPVVGTHIGPYAAGVVVIKK